MPRACLEFNCKPCTQANRAGDMKLTNEPTPRLTPTEWLASHRPLVLGLRRSANGGGDEWCVASEDCAFGPIGFRRVRDVAPGEMIVIDPEGQLHSRQCVPGQVRRHHLDEGVSKGWGGRYAHGRSLESCLPCGDSSQAYCVCADDPGCSSPGRATGCMTRQQTLASCPRGSHASMSRRLLPLRVSGYHSAPAGSRHSSAR